MVAAPQKQSDVTNRSADCKALVIANIIATAIAATLTLALIRGRIAGILFRDNLSDPLLLAWRILGSVFYDLIFMTIASSIVVVLCYPRFLQVLRMPLRLAFMVFSITIIMIYIAHISIMKYLSRPLTYQWIYYSDFLGSLDAKQAIIANMNRPLFLITAAIITVFFVVRRILIAYLSTAVIKLGASAVMIGCGIVVVACLLLSNWQMHQEKLPYPKVAQPIVVFALSLFGNNSTIFSVPVSADISDFEPRTVAARYKQSSALYSTQAPESQASTSLVSPIRNVVFFVMESAAARYFGTYGSTLGATPILDKFRTSALIVSDAYAHAPATNMTLVSLLTGTYPWTAEQLVTSEFPAIDLPSISSILKNHGYQTSFFSAADLRYQKADEFLGYRNFDVIRDYRAIPCSSGPNHNSSKESFSSIGWAFLDGINDECAVSAMNDWIAANKEKPFFAVLWTQMTHYPYIVEGPEKNFFTKDPDENRYLNALRIGDQALGRLLSHLEQLKIADSTLVVVLGDHGEAFGRHGDRVHGSAIYDDNLRIPLLFINPALFSGSVIDTVGGIADIPPTVIEILGITTPEKWQGRSLLDSTRAPRTFFFTPWGELLFGYRDGQFKYIYNASSDTIEVYDLSKDPQESSNLAYKFSQAELSHVKSRIASWAQYQNTMVRSNATLENATCLEGNLSGDVSVRSAQCKTSLGVGSSVATP
jgi:arylsulfatase A-like enzyme